MKVNKYTPGIKKELARERLKKALLVQKMNNELSGASEIDISPFVNQDGSVNEKAVTRHYRNGIIMEMFCAGSNIQEIADFFELSYKSVQNIIKASGSIVGTGYKDKAVV